MQWLIILFWLSHSFQINGDGKNTLLKIWEEFHDTNYISPFEKLYCTVDGCPANIMDCENIGSSDHQCDDWKNIGLCKSNPGYMLEKCSKSCQSCFVHVLEYRCAPRWDNYIVKQPNDIENMFLNIINGKEYQKYSPKVWNTDPYIITLDNFLNDDEINMILNHGLGYKKSRVHGKLLPDGTFEIITGSDRLSETSWCTGACYERRSMLDLMQKIADITGSEPNNAEFPQILKYNQNGWYNRHSDFSDGHLDLPMGPRIYTFFMYLNDVEEGGETEFTDLVPPVRITPKKGRALLWHNVKLDNYKQRHPLAFHKACHVKKGIKHAVNLWIHERNFHEPWEIGCTG